MDSIFSAAWNDLELEHVRTFLGGAGDEGLTWECKGEKNGQSVTTKAIGEGVCGFANSLGGYLILGAEQTSANRSWSLPGLCLDDPEPIAWASRVICDRLRPIPRFDVRSWPIEGKRHVVVVQVSPIGVAPCLTVDGLAFERVTSQTKKVVDPVRLADLLQQGQASRDESERKARAAAALLDGGVPFGDTPGLRTRMTIGLAATGYTPDIASRLFSERFMTALDEKVVAMAKGFESPFQDVNVRRTRSHSHSTVEMLALVPGPTMPEEQRLGVVAAWDGGVNLSWDTTTREVTAGFGADTVCGMGWSLVHDLVRSLGGYGEAHLAVRAASAAANRAGNVVNLVQPIERTVAIGEPESLDLAGLKREMLRASGVTTYEP
jgi:Putative DNA-binding domain